MSGTSCVEPEPRLARLAGRLRRRGLRGGLAALGRRALSLAGTRARGLIFVVTRDDLRPVQPRLAAGQRCTFHDDRPSDLLRWRGDAETTAAAIAATLREAARPAGRRLHTVLVGDELAGWGWSYRPTGPAFLTETRTRLEFAPGATSLYGFHTVPEHRGRRLYQTLLAHIVAQRFGEGARCAYITCLATNAASRAGIERVGFRLVAVHDYHRILGWSRTRRRPAAEGRCAS